jgi:hypothetical protein
MNRLRIIIEKTGNGPDDYRCVYVGEDGLKASIALKDPSALPRAEFRGLPVAKNRQLITLASGAPVTPAVLETKIDSQKTKKK